MLHAVVGQKVAQTASNWAVQQSAMTHGPLHIGASSVNPENSVGISISNFQVGFNVCKVDNGFILQTSNRQLVARDMDELRDLITAELVGKFLENK